jgi:hypothetical protein
VTGPPPCPVCGTADCWHRARVRRALALAVDYTMPPDEQEPTAWD